MEHSIPTRMGDGALVRMTPAEIAHLLDIFSSRSRFSAVDIGDEVTLSYDGCGSRDIGTRVNDLQYYEQYLPSTPSSASRR